MGFGAVGGHVRIPTEGALAFFFRSLQNRGRIGVLHQHVSAGVDQAGGSFGFFWWVKPLVDPDHFGLDLGVHRLRAHGEAVDIADDLRDWHRCDHADHVALGHGTGDHAVHVRAFIGAAVIGAHVVSGFVTGGVLKLDIFELGRQLHHGFHVAEGGAENDFVALAGHVADHALGVSGLGHVLDKAGGNFVAKFLFQGLAGVVVRKGPAAIAHRADISEGDLQRLRLRSGRGCLYYGGGRWRLFFFAAANQGHRCGGTDHCQLEQGTQLQICHVKSFEKQGGE